MYNSKAFKQVTFKPLFGIYSEMSFRKFSGRTFGLTSMIYEKLRSGYSDLITEIVHNRGSSLGPDTDVIFGCCG